MNARVFSVAAALSLVGSLAGCTKDEGHEPAAPLPVVGISANLTSVVANGTNTVGISVTDTGGGPVAITTTRGTFAGGGQSATVQGSSGALTLVTCDTSTDVTCAGVATVTASSTTGTASTQITFGALSSVCPTNCSADPACAGTACTPPGGGQGTCSSASPSTCVAATSCASKPEVCNDGVDNDCDAAIDCADTSCQPRGNELGAVCDANGMTCSVNLGSGSTCSVCSGNGGRIEPAEESCGDGIDNDCDGIIDCQDSDCAGLACNTAGKTCTAATRRCECNSPEATGEMTCDDGSDNDCDGKIDCADEDCNADVCGPNGATCAGTACKCTGNGGVAEASETRCGDLHDNDCDGTLDCADSDCRPAPGATYGLSCDTSGTAGMRCNASSACVCSGNGGAPEATESSCADGFDNDCDGLADCGDPDCRPAGLAAGKACDTRGNTCSATGTCTVCSGNGGPVEVAEATCNDNRDNDCDGKADCADDQCATRACNALVPTQVCLSLGTPPVPTCADPTSMYSVTVTATRTRIPADGVNTSDVTATFKKNGAAIPSAVCTFGPAARFPTPSTASTNAAGAATLRFTSSAAGGTANVTVSCVDGGVTIVGTLPIDQPLLGLVRLQDQQFSVLGARGSGFQEKSLLTFELLDSTGRTYPDGLLVNFRHESQGDSFLGARSNCTAAVPSICTESGVTDASGKVQVLLTSGRKFSLLAVSATATAGGVTGFAPAGNIAVVGAKASGARLALDCELDNVPALVDHDCTTSFVDTKVTCTASLADRHGIVLGFPTVVAFKSEAGAAGVPGVTALYDGTPSGNAQLGYASTGIAVYGHALPSDVAPFAGEFSLDYVGGCGLRTHNPRDGLSTVVAMVNGEEGFVDLDSDGEYDLGEPFIDMGEPFVDANDNGIWDPDEWFEDTNRNRAYDGPNGVWDSDTTIWTQTRIVYTGLPLVGQDSVTGQDLASRWFRVGSPPSPTTPPTYSVNAGPPATSDVVDIFLTDENFNPLSSAAAFDIKAMTSTVTADWFVEPSVVDTLGASYRLLYCDDPIAPTVCAGGTPEQACTTSPCYVVPDVGLCASGTCVGFQYGTFGSGIMTGTTELGPGFVGASATIFGVKTTVFVSGTNAP